MGKGETHRSRRKKGKTLLGSAELVGLWKGVPTQRRAHSEDRSEMEAIFICYNFKQRETSNISIIA